MYFESSIPQGYGLGSSGALVASLYDRYANNKINRNRSLSNEEILELKDIFAQLESFFHGTSSGLDPLNAYIKFPVLIKDKDTIEVVGLPRNKVSGEGAIFLINTGMPKKTEPLVNEFMRRNENDTYKSKIFNELIPLNNSLISDLVNGNLDTFFNNLSQLSRFQMENMEFMIPDDYKDVWQKGYETGDYSLKLCGSGGGGFILGFTKDFSKTKHLFKDQNLDLVTVFKNPK
jgi:mevalonate kinase